MFETGEFSAEILKNAFEGRSRYGGDDPGRKLGSMGYFTYLYIHRENGATLDMVPLIVNPICTLYSGYLLGISPFKRAPWGG